MPLLQKLFVSLHVSVDWPVLGISPAPRGRVHAQQAKTRANRLQSVPHALTQLMPHGAALEPDQDCLSSMCVNTQLRRTLMSSALNTASGPSTSLSTSVQIARDAPVGLRGARSAMRRQKQRLQVAHTAHKLELRPT